MDLPTLRRRGVEPALGDALAHLLRPGGPQGFWVHLDVDVLDEAVMPAVDYRLPDGLTWDELATASGRPWPPATSPASTSPSSTRPLTATAGSPAPSSTPWVAGLT